MYRYIHSSGRFPCFFSCFFRLAATTKANGFSKGAQAIARFHALGQSLPMPHWYTNAAIWVLWNTPCTASIGCGNWSHWCLAEFVTPWGLLWSKGWWTTTHVSSSRVSRASFQLLPIHTLLLWNLLPTTPRSFMLPSGRPKLLRASKAMQMNHDEASLHQSSIVRRFTAQGKDGDIQEDELPSPRSVSFPWVLEWNLEHLRALGTLQTPRGGGHIVNASFMSCRLRVNKCKQWSTLQENVCMMWILWFFHRVW